MTLGYAWLLLAPLGCSSPARAASGRSLPCALGSSPSRSATVVSIVKALLQAGELSARDIGIVTPYASQVGVIRQSLAMISDGRQLEVHSVDGFQGREKEVIVFSAVRAGRGGSLGFVSDARRLNVLLTRAKRGLIVVGEPRTLVHSSHWANWLQWVQRERAVVGHPNWSMPHRPHGQRDRSPSASSELDELGRRIRRSRSRSRDRDDIPKPRRADRRKARQAKRADAASSAADGGTGGDDEALWRQTLREAAENAEARGGRHPSALSVSDGLPLLPNWFAAFDEAGKPYYHNAATLEVCWEAPLAAKRPLLEAVPDSKVRQGEKPKALEEAEVKLEEDEVKLEEAEVKFEEVEPQQ